jgi:predicted phosphodiesterase
MAKSAKSAHPHTPAHPAGKPLRFAHPFFTLTPPDQRTAQPGVGRRMTDWIAQQLGPIPKPSRDPAISLDEIIGAAGVKEIEDLGTIRFHAVGDTGRAAGENTPQDQVAADMALDYHPDAGGMNPAFFLHLGDVIYGPNKVDHYRNEFYTPYKQYPGKIVAVAGNHDGETFPKTDTVPLEAFLDNFCAPTAAVPPIASGAGIFRQTMTEPGVYWLLDAPFVQVIGLYSNIADGPGYLTGAGGDATQTKWLAQALGSVAADRKGGTRKALIVAVHHPPYSNGGHSGSPAVLAALDAAADAAGVMPDAVLSGHAHNYQRHTRRISFRGRPMEIPFVVAGCGGHNAAAVGQAYGQVIGDRTFDKSLHGYGYLLVTVTPQTLKVDMWEVPSTANIPFDTVTVDLATSRVS